jgi:hypothetical protein
MKTGNCYLTVIKEQESVRLLHSGYNWIIVNDKSKGTRKKGVMVYFKAIPRICQKESGKQLEVSVMIGCEPDTFQRGFGCSSSLYLTCCGVAEVWTQSTMWSCQVGVTVLHTGVSINN